MLFFPVPYINGKVFVTQDYRTKLDNLVAHASIKLSVMGGLVDIGG